ncbi:MAG: aminopeptidase P family N-terminal domain-containing protein [Chloroflexi bacterium]|nr:aminopeptidase P family N-terminal domain-containing protein [Chloroflexota bacterium]
MGCAEFAISEGSGDLVEALPFTTTEYQHRLAALRHELASLDADAFVSFTPENIYYLTGHDTPGYYFFQACVVTATGTPVNVLRRIESTNTLWRSWGRRAVIYEDRDDPRSPPSGCCGIWASRAGRSLLRQSSRPEHLCRPLGVKG